MLKKLLLKISGEALLGKQQFGIDYEPVEMIANEIKSIYDKGVEVAVVVGGGNIFRGMKNSAKLGMDQASGDYVGMLATVMNAVALQCALKKIGLVTKSRPKETLGISDICGRLCAVVFASVVPAFFNSTLLIFSTLIGLISVIKTPFF